MACVQKQVGAVLMQDPFARVQSIWVTAPPIAFGSVPSSRCRKVSRLRLSFFAVFFMACLSLGPPRGPIRCSVNKV